MDDWRSLKQLFSEAKYLATCPKGHSLELSNGDSVYAPGAWEQWGRCNECGKDVARTVSVRNGKFESGPIHWRNEETKEDEDWLHDVLNHHHCDRCWELAKKDLAEDILGMIEGRGNIDVVRRYVKMVAG